MKKNIIPNLSTGLVFSALILFAISCSKEKSTDVPVIKRSSVVKTIVTIDELNEIIDSNEKMLVFDLYADWCMPCKVLAPTFNSLSEIHNNDAVFYRVNVDKSPEIAAAFGVRGIPYVVFVKNKKAIYALTGVNPKESYEKVLKGCATATSEQACAQLLESM